MTEQPQQPRPGEDDDGAQAGGADVARAGGGRTEGETGVDDQLGQGDEPAR